MTDTRFITYIINWCKVPDSHFILKEMISGLIAVINYETGLNSLALTLRMIKSMQM